MAASDQSPASAAFQIRQCKRDECRFRYPVSVDSPDVGPCPACHESAQTVLGPFKSSRPTTELKEHFGMAFEVFLDNIRSSHNVGSILRTCDGAGIDHMHMCGITSTPGQVKVRKTALGAERAVPWTYYRNGVDAVQELKKLGYRIWSLENTAPSQSVFDLGATDLPERMVLVVGNELSGVDPGIMALSDKIVSMPMAGTKSSLNVAVALGVAVYWLRHGIRSKVRPF